MALSANFLSELLYNLPILLVMVVGALIALARWNRHPRTSLLVVIGVVLMMVSRILLSMSGQYLPGILINVWRIFPFLRGRAATLVLDYSIILIEALGMILILWGAFQRRGTETA